MIVLKYANLALAFLLELCALAALGYWGFVTAGGLPAKIGLGVGCRCWRRCCGAYSSRPGPRCHCRSRGTCSSRWRSSDVPPLRSTPPIARLALVFALVVILNQVLVYV
jgi:hypothetical protein